MDWLASASLNSSNTSTGLGVFDNSDPSSIFDALTQNQNGMENLSNQFLNTGIDHYLKKDYEKAAKSFQAATSLAPNSTHSVETTEYLAQAYLKLEKPDKAIAAYKAAIEHNPTEDQLRNDLGKLYYAQNDYEDSAAQYKAAVQANPSSTNRYSYGEALLKVKNYSEAEHQFQEVKRLDPESYAGDYGLGKLYEDTGDYNRAIDHFQQALKLDPTFYDAQAEIGYTYTDMGNIDEARKVQEQLSKKDEDLAGTLKSYIDEKEPPEITFNWGSATFPSKMSMNTPLSALDSYLTTPGASKSFTMKFQFNKQMDRSSVENILNWSISRASSTNLAKTYNFGSTIPSTEVTPPAFPDYVLYDANTMTGTVGFTLTQNSTGDGTIDPEHIDFKFNGKDANGIKIDPNYDEYTGFSGVA